MNILGRHNFHIPVLGLGYSIDTPIQVAPYGISSVISLVDDSLTESMREFYSKKFDFPFQAISEKIEDFRAKRITSYLNMVDVIIKQKVENLKRTAFEAGSEFEKYVDMLPNFSELKKKFVEAAKDIKIKEELKNWIEEHLPVGDIDVNIMTKLDKVNYKDGEELPIEYNDAHAALRGFANSNLSSSLVLSAGMSPRLYSYLEKFEDFFPDANGIVKKKIILKVSDFRSALVQGKMLAAKGIWVSEYRIESGVNCGGHAFPTNGLLFGPILEEFKQNRSTLLETCIGVYENAIETKGLNKPAQTPELLVTAQGGVGTSDEHNYLMEKYNMDSVGWGTPFMLVPEVISIDNQTLDLLANAKEKDLYFSGLSPLGVPFNSVKWASMSELRWARFQEGKPGSPCTKQYLKYNTEYTEKPICTASKQYQTLKIEELKQAGLSEEAYQKKLMKIIEPECLCVGLGISLLESKGIPVKDTDKVTVCPGPNLAYFSKKSTLKEMVDHIYGRTNLLDEGHRPHMFLKEFKMYVDILKERVEELDAEDAKAKKQIVAFVKNINSGVEYYESISEELESDFATDLAKLKEEVAVITKDL